MISLPLENPQMLWLILPVLAVGICLIKKGAKTGLVESRLIIALLLIIALASPYTLVSKTTMDETPNLVIISDETTSMQLFEEGIASRIYEALTAKTPTTIVTVSGDKTSIGDAIIQYSRGDNQIVLVTDGNNNYGKTLEDAFKFAKETGTTVYSIEPELKVNDLSVEIKGDKTVVLDNENEIEVVVSQAGNGEISYRIEIDYFDEYKPRSRTITQSTREKTTSFMHTYTELGAHKVKVTLTPLSGDWDQINNVFYKSIYVVPKPKIQLIADNIESPLAKILFDLYDVSTTDRLSDIDDKKVIVLDNKHINTLSENDIKTLKKYVTDGNGLVVAGGERAYDYGDYLDSSFEELLPVMSKPTDWRGGRNIILLLDMSGSTRSAPYAPAKATEWKYGQKITYEEELQPSLLSYIYNNAIHIINDPDNRDAYVAVISFEKEANDISGGFVYLGVESNRDEIIKNIIEFKGAESTNLPKGLIMAEELLEQSAGSQNIVILSDGLSDETSEKYYDDIVEVAKGLRDKGINIFFIHHIMGIDVSTRPGNLMNEIGQPQNYILSKEQTVNIVFEELEKPPEDETITLYVFPLIEYNPKHFITRNIEIAGNITGYNDVTPKAGADRIIITSTGKPVLTTWRYGLGRVASLTTDNGYGGGSIWSSQMYAGNNSKLTSATLNWAIGNPRVEEGAVLEGMDAWFGTPVTLTLTMYDEGVLPTLTLDGTEALELSVIGKNTYDTTIDPDRIGMHDISGYPVAVNYALEYRDVGLNEELSVLVKSSGGKTYTTESEARAYLLKDAKANSKRVVQEPVSWKMYFIIGALLLFLLEIVIRRIKEIQAAKRAERMG